MSLQSNLKKRYFPSYNQIHQSILNQRKKQYEYKIGQLQNKIQRIKQYFHVEQQHQQIKAKLLRNYNSNDHKIIADSLSGNGEKLERENNWMMSASNMRTSTASGGYGSADNNAFSLNYCIDDDTQEENHFQNHLKFKKQVLERDLFQESWGHHKKDKGKQIDEDYIFKNLYNNQRPNTAIGITPPGLKPHSQLKKQFIVSDNTKQFKQNMKQLKKSQSPFVSYKNKTGKLLSQKQPNKLSGKNTYSRNNSSSTLNKCQRKQASENEFIEQHQICHKNAKILKDNYGKYLKELEGTNIIKWRVLRGDKENKTKQKEAITLSVNPTAIKTHSITKD